ncbi:hypothetical protein LSH36_37g04029 [Paralvinella palmiformis]|uniref:DUF7402 domain-containing protein n=1 Tax=Paralvinella palmiformis TaxID=53620 RepID=A0AAD9K8A0_9ANNE|nr:hypothetical protein LSH36_37g04029 [Paralvinella palmiformis]
MASHRVVPVLLLVLMLEMVDAVRGQNAMNASFRRHQGMYYSKTRLAIDDTMSGIECSLWCLSNWVCTGYQLQWIKPDSGYCLITRESNPLSNLVHDPGYTFFETISYNIPYVNIALTSPPFSTTCTASSNLNNDLVLHGCEKVMDGQDCDADQCNWVSAGQGVDSWIQLTFKRIWNIVRVDAHSRHSPLDQCSQLEFQFSDDPPVQVERQCQLGPTMDYFKLDHPKRSDFVRIRCQQSCPGVVNHGFTEVLIWALP